MNKSVQGMSLIPVLLLAQLIALISTYSFNSITFNFKLNHDLLQREINLRAAQNTVKRIEANLEIEDQNCLINTSSPYRFSQKSINWWREVGCQHHNKDYEYYYVVEFLGNDACSIVQKRDDVILSAKYYRLTILWLKPRARFVSILLQTTMIKPIVSSQHCQSVEHLVSSGVQSLRELMVKSVD